MTHLSPARRAILGLSRRWKEFTFRPFILERPYHELSVKLSIEDTFGQTWYGLDHNEWPELDWIAEHGIRRGDVVVDCGANNGFTSILFSRFTGPAGKVFAIDPVPHNAAIIRKNLELNSVTNCEVIEAAVGETVGTAQMPDVPNGSLLPRHFGPKSRMLQVPVTTVDAIAGNTNVGFLKVDVEGFERQVLLGAARVLAGKPRMDLELHVAYYDDKAAEVAAILELLDLSGRQVFLQMDVDGPIDEVVGDRNTLATRIASGEIVHLYLR